MCLFKKWGGSHLVVIACIWVVFMCEGSSQSLSASVVLKDEKTFELLYVQGSKSQYITLNQACNFYLGSSVSEKRQFWFRDGHFGGYLCLLLIIDNFICSQTFFSFQFHIWGLFMAFFPAGVKTVCSWKPLSPGVCRLWLSSLLISAWMQLKWAALLVFPYMGYLLDIELFLQFLSKQRNICSSFSKLCVKWPQELISQE